jgi:hypothetical protein
MASFQQRVAGVLQLLPATFEEIEHDATAIQQAAIVVGAAAVAKGLGLFPYLGLYAVRFFIFTLVFAFIGWAVGSAVLWAVGTKLMPGKNTEADVLQMMRVTGFAQAPTILAVFQIIPFLGWLISFLGAIWCLVCLVVGVRQALEYDDTVKAIIVCVIAFVAMWIVMALAGLVIGAGMGVGMGMGMPGRYY